MGQRKPSKGNDVALMKGTLRDVRLSSRVSSWSSGNQDWEFLRSGLWSFKGMSAGLKRAAKRGLP